MDIVREIDDKTSLALHMQIAAGISSARNSVGRMRCDTMGQGKVSRKGTAGG